MSQIAHSQLALKKRSTPVTVTEASAIVETQKVSRKSNGISEQKNDKDIIIIDDEYAAIPIAREEIVEEEGVKKRRNRRSKNSADSRESSEFAIKKPEEVTPKQNKSHSDEKSPDSFTASAAAATVDDFPTPEASPKVGKLTADALLSKRRSDRLQNASTIVNLSTATASDETPSQDRRFVGRRGTRPVDDLLKYAYRTPADDSLNATTNATIGSEVGDSMLETPATDRKRRIESDETTESPKRSRLDLSALFNNFYSPVSILRSKFKRTNLASTPKADGCLLDDSEASLNSTDMKEIDLNEDSAAKETESEVKIIVKPPAKKSACSIM